MIFDLLKLNIHVSDETFDELYPEEIRQMAKKHWSPVDVAKSASEFLVHKPGTRVLDIGSGAGKFCLIGAAHTDGYFTGVEQRAELVTLSRKISYSSCLRNVEFLHGNITAINFANYDSFYFYNSFYENIDSSNTIDSTVKLDIRLYHQYCRHIIEQFRCSPIGTRLVTFWTPLSIIPKSFKLAYATHGGLLKFWEKDQHMERLSIENYGSKKNNIIL